MLTALAFMVLSQCVPPPEPDTVEARLAGYAVGKCYTTRWDVDPGAVPYWYDEMTPKQQQAERVRRIRGILLNPALHKSPVPQFNPAINTIHIDTLEHSAG